MCCAGLDKDIFAETIRLLSVTELCTNATRIDYASFAEVLAVPVDDVEVWVLETMKRELVGAQLDQLDQAVIAQCVVTL